jgi:gamma-glutamylcyclotransferase (GGCT)/AIG2-like uncharacterized protein YtfP
MSAISAVHLEQLITEWRGRASPLIERSPSGLVYKECAAQLERVLADGEVRDVFVYGTLCPGQNRWPSLEQFAAAVTLDTVVGQLYDTTLGFPAAVITEPGTVPGYTVTMKEGEADLGFAVLDRIEGHPDAYMRSIVITGNGTRAWVYHWPWDTSKWTRIERWIA